MGPLWPLFVFSTILSLSPAAFAELYQWTDADGVVHFTDQKPAGQRSAIRQLPEVSTVQTRSSGSFRYNGETGSQNARGKAQRRRAGRASADEAACVKTRASLEKVQSQLRDGYREPQGNRLREKRRVLRDRYAQLCR